MKKLLKLFLIIALILSFLSVLIKITTPRENKTEPVTYQPSVKQDDHNIKSPLDNSLKPEKTQSSITQGFSIQKEVAMPITTKAHVSIRVHYVLSGNGNIDSVEKVTSQSIGSNDYEWLQSSYSTKAVDGGRGVEIKINGTQVEYYRENNSNKSKKTQGTVVLEIP